MDSEDQAASYALQLEALTALHSSCQAEVDRTRELLDMKDHQVSSLLRALQMATAQVRGGGEGAGR